jgi:haloacetate dehalogenase
VFEGFTEEHVDLGGVTLFVRHGGDGPAVLLLHGHPRTSATWWQVAPRLREAGFGVVCPDLRGYGRSSKPPTTPDHRPYSKRVMAADMAALLRRLGHDRAAVAGHDRGGYVAFRLAMDHPGLITRAALLDCVPIGEALSRCREDFARRWWHWFFFAQPDKPERAILADPLAWYGGSPRHMGPEAFAEYRAAVEDPGTVRAMLEDYRAGLGPDREDDDADERAGRRLRVPALVLWSGRDDLESLYGDPLEVWRGWADDLRGHAVDSGHHMAEEAPGALSRALSCFFAPLLDGEAEAQRGDGRNN